MNHVETPENRHPVKQDVLKINDEIQGNNAHHKSQVRRQRHIIEQTQTLLSGIEGDPRGGHRGEKPQ